MSKPQGDDASSTDEDKLAVPLSAFPWRHRVCLPRSHNKVEELLQRHTENGFKSLKNRKLNNTPNPTTVVVSIELTQCLSVFLPVEC